MHNLRHFYYQNKEKIWKVVLIIAFILGLIYFLNDLAKKENTLNSNISINENSIYKDEENKTYISDKAAIYGETVTQQEVERINNTISNFLQYCKTENYEQAYNMLTKECKQNEYATLQQFEEEYIRPHFNKNVIYEIEKWLNNTYKITISNDLLVTGDVSNNKKYIDYITIVKEDNEEKLNINSFIEQKEINKEVIQNEVKITVLSKRTYQDYEIYDFKIENLSENTIKLDSLENIGTMYLVDSNGVRYNAYTNEILQDQVEIRSKHYFNISIRYSNIYTKRASIDKVVFENIILDYSKYKTVQQDQQANYIRRIEIDL